jgi:hypothetical protein
LASAGPANLRKPASSPGYIEKPIFMIGAPNFAPAPAMRRSQALAISSPPPTQGPRIAATVGTGQDSIAASASPTASW